MTKKEKKEILERLTNQILYYGKMLNMNPISAGYWSGKIEATKDIITILVKEF